MPEERSPVWVNIFNLISSIAGITGISLLWVRDKFTLTNATIVAFVFCCGVGLGISTIVLNWGNYLYKEKKDEWSIEALRTFLVIITIATGTLMFFYYIFCLKFLFQILINLQN